MSQKEVAAHTEPADPVAVGQQSSTQTSTANTGEKKKNKKKKKKKNKKNNAASTAEVGGNGEEESTIPGNGESTDSIAASDSVPDTPIEIAEPDQLAKNEVLIRDNEEAIDETITNSVQAEASETTDAPVTVVSDEAKTVIEPSVDPTEAHSLQETVSASEEKSVTTEPLQAHEEVIASQHPAEAETGMVTEMYPEEAQVDVPDPIQQAAPSQPLVEEVSESVPDINDESLNTDNGSDLFGSSANDALPWDQPSSETPAVVDSTPIPAETTPIEDQKSFEIEEPVNICEPQELEQPAVNTEKLNKDVETVISEESDTALPKAIVPEGLNTDNVDKSSEEKPAEASTDVPSVEGMHQGDLEQEAVKSIDQPEDPTVNDKLEQLDFEDEDADLFGSSYGSEALPWDNKGAESESIEQAQVSTSNGTEEPGKASGDLFASSTTPEPLPWEQTSSTPAPEQASSDKPDVVISKLEKLSLDDEFLDDDFLDDELDNTPAAPKQNEPQRQSIKTHYTSSNAPNPYVAQPASYNHFNQPPQHAQQAPQAQQVTQQHGYNSYQPNIQQNIYAQHQNFQQPQHHIDLQKLNENKKKSDAYDFPTDLMPSRPVHKPSRVPSLAQMNQQFSNQQAAMQPPSMVSPVETRKPSLPTMGPPSSGTPNAGASFGSQPASNYGPRSITPGYSSVPSNGRAAGSTPPLRKKQSSFFEELPIPPVVPAARRRGSNMTASPLASTATLHQPALHGQFAQFAQPPSQPSPYAAPQAMAPPKGPPSRPPSTNKYRAPSISGTAGIPGQAQQLPSFGGQVQPSSNASVVNSPKEVSTGQLGVSASAHPSAAKSPRATNSRYAPSSVSATPPVTSQANHGALHPQMQQQPQPQQPQFLQPAQLQQSPLPAPSHPSPSMSNANKYAPHAGGGVPPKPQVNTQLAPSQAKSPLQNMISPNVSKYAPINHTRQASTSAAQYDPNVAKFQGITPQLPTIQHNAPFQHQAPPQQPGAHSAPVTGAPQMQQKYQQPRPQQAAAQVPVQYQQRMTSVVSSTVNPEELLKRQFPLFSWSGGNKVSYLIPPTSFQYGGNSIKVINSDKVLSESLLTDFPIASKKNIALVEKFLDIRTQELSSTRSSKSDNDEILLIQLLKHKLSKQPGPFNLGGTMNYNDQAPQIFNESTSSSALQALSKRHLVSLISTGQKNEALKLALSHENFSLALIISSVINKEAWLGMVESYLNKEFTGDNDHILPTLFRILAGDCEKVVASFNEPTKKAFAINNWKEISSAIFLNNPPCLIQFLKLFGEFLISNGESVAGYILFMMGDLPLDHFQDWTSLKSTLYLEIYGLILQEKKVQVDLSNILLQHAYYLAEYDMLSEAQKYLDMAGTSFKSGKKTDASALYHLRLLSDRLAGSNITDNSWFAKPKLERVWGTLDKSLNKLISGDELNAEKKDTGVFSKFSPSVSRTSSMVSMHNVSLGGHDSQILPRPLAGPPRHSSPYAPSSASFSESMGQGPKAYTPAADLQKKPYGPPAASRSAVPFDELSKTVPAGPLPFQAPPVLNRQNSYQGYPSAPRSPKGKTSRYAAPPANAVSAPIDQSSRRSSFHSHASSIDDQLYIKPLPPMNPTHHPAPLPPSGLSQNDPIDPLGPIASPPVPDPVSSPPIRPTSKPDAHLPVSHEAVSREESTLESNHSQNQYTFPSTGGESTIKEESNSGIPNTEHEVSADNLPASEVPNHLPDSELPNPPEENYEDQDNEQAIEENVQTDLGIGEISSLVTPQITKAAINPYAPPLAHVEPVSTKSTRFTPKSYTPSSQQENTIPSDASPYAPPRKTSNPYAPPIVQESNFSPYQPLSNDGTVNSTSTLNSLPSQSYNPGESKFNPPSSGISSSLGSQNGYEPPSARFTAYEPPKTNHEISNIPEEDEYDDFVEDEDDDSDEEDENKKKKDSKKESKKPKKVDDNDDHDDAGNTSGWFGWLRKDKKNGPTVYRAKLGEKSNFHYDEKLGRWINGNLSPEELAKIEAEAKQKAAPPPIVKKKPSNIGKPRSGSMSESGSISAPSPAAPPGGPPSGPKRNATPSGGGSDLDSLMNLTGGGGASTRRRQKRGYVDVMAKSQGK